MDDAVLDVSDRDKSDVRGLRLLTNPKNEAVHLPLESLVLGDHM